MRRLDVADQASGFLPPMEQKDNTSGSIWSMASRAARPNHCGGVIRRLQEERSAYFFSDASLFGLQSNDQRR